MKAYASTLKAVGVDLRENQKKYRVGKTKRASTAGAPAELIELKDGMVPFGSIDTLARRLEVDAGDLLNLIGIPARTAARRKDRGYLKSDEADRLLRLARVAEEATRIFGSDDKAALWFKTAHPSLGDAAPLSLLDSDAGTKAVTDELIRIDYGDFA